MSPERLRALLAFSGAGALASSLIVSLYTGLLSPPAILLAVAGAALVVLAARLEEIAG